MVLRDLGDGMKVALIAKHLRRSLTARRTGLAGMSWRGDVSLGVKHRVVYGQEESTMSSTISKTMGFALAGLLCMAPLSMAAGTATEKTPGTSSTQVQQPSPNLPSAQAGDRLMATVEGVDQSKGTLKLRAADGDRMEFKVPKGMLASLHEGDRVQIAIQKAPGTPERGPTSGTERQRPEQPR
jgi:hypothetical protein